MLSRGSVLVALTTLVALVFYHGFELEAHQNTVIGYVVRGSIGYYLVKYLLELLYNFHPLQFLKDRKWEGIFDALFDCGYFNYQFNGFRVAQ